MSASRRPSWLLGVSFRGRRPGPRLGVAPVSWGVSGATGRGFQMPVERVLAEARELGLDGLEAGPPGFLRRRPRGLPRLLVAAGTLEPLVDRSELPAVDGHARRLRGLGAQLMLVTARRGDEAITPALEAQGWARFFDALAGIESICRQHGLDLAFHPRPGSQVGDQAELERFLVGCEVGICLDTGDLQVAGMDPVEVVELAAGRIRHLHLKDVDPGLLAQVRSGGLSHDEAIGRGLYRPLGQAGGRALPALEDALRGGFQGWLMIEQERRLDCQPPPGGGPIADIQQSVELVRRRL